jgi:ADP-ribose pyrophosphatase
LQISDGIGVLLYDPLEDQIVLVEQFRAGALKSAAEPWFLEIVAGVIESDDTHLSVAKRESLEETGIYIDEILPMVNYFVNPCNSTQKMYLYCARVDTKDYNPNVSYGVRSENEDIKVHIIDLEKAYEAVSSGIINNSLTIIAILWIKLNKSQVYKKWQI